MATSKPTTTGAVSCQRMNIQMVQNVLLIWLDSNIDDNSADCRNTTMQLRPVVNTINKFTDGDQCLEFLETIEDEKACMIISGSLGELIMPLVHDMSQVDSIFILCSNKEYHEQWAKEWPKIKGIFTDIGPICEALKKATQQCEQDAMSISFIGTSGDVSKKNLDQLEPSFMYTQIMKEILLTISFKQEHINEFLQHCRDAFVDNERELNNVKKFEQQYRDKTPIWWYTCECFLYPMLNRALRLMDVDMIIKLGFFINDLHRHIEQLHQEQVSNGNLQKSFTVYRGQGLSEVDFEQMSKTKGGLMSFNNFLSTSKNYNVSLRFANRATTKPGMVGILFVMTIDPKQSTTPFASIINVSYFQGKEDEVLFSMHTVFRIGEITLMDENNRLFQVKLNLTSDNDKDFRALTDCIREESFPNSSGWYRLGLVLRKMGQLEKAEQVSEVLLGQAMKESDKAPIYDQLGSAKYSRGEYAEAIKYYEKALEICKKTLSSTDLHLAVSYNNIGLVYENMGDYPKALLSHEKALAIKQQSLSRNHPDLAASYNNIGSVYDKMGDYPKALSYFEKGLEISKQSLPPNHPDLAASYNNIGLVYFDMGDYPKALSYYEKDLEISKQSLPPNHPHLAASYNNIGLVYFDIGDYRKALSSYEKALAIRQQSLPPNHPDLASSYGNIGNVYSNTGDYPKALSSHEKTLAIQQQSLPPNHPSFAASYNNIGAVYQKMGDYPKALSHYEKDLEISKQSLPANHPDLASSYRNIGLVYFDMGDYPKALSSYEKALAIRQQSLPPNHPDLGSFYNNIGSVYANMKNYSEARSFFARAVDIGQQSLPENHPNLQGWRRNLERVKKNLK